MFSKLVLASAAVATTEAMHLKLHSKSKAVKETCDYNIDRMTSGSNVDGSFSKYSNGGAMFEDPDFPAEESSLFWRGNLYDSEQPQNYIDKMTGWARPSELTKNPSLWGSKGVRPAGTRQGMLGSCWFLASAAALAERPERIKQIFTNSDYDSAGIFEVTFYHMTEEVKVVVDDRLPIVEGLDPKYTNFGVKTPFSTKESDNGAWWVPILEKAFAKYNVNYSQLNGGQPGVAFRELTGMPVHVQKLKEQSDEEFYAMVSDADNRDWAMAAGCQNEHAGLITGHAYTVLGSIKLDGGPQLVKVRNPWSREEYTGPFRDDDPAWTAAWKTQAGLVAGNDGVFHIPVADFKKAFTTYSVAMYQDWHEADPKVVEGAKKIFGPWTFTSAVDQTVILTLDFQNPRQVPRGCPEDGDNIFNKINYNMYIDGGDPIAASSQMGYGDHKMEMKAGSSHKLQVYNWGDATYDSHFVLSLYGADGDVTWS